MIFRTAVTVLAAVFRNLAYGLLLTVILVLGGSTFWYYVRSTQTIVLPPPGLNPKLLASAHKHLTQREIGQMLSETYYERPWIYAPYVGFTERPRHGHFVTVSEENFRVGANPGAKLSDPTVRKLCFLGGSTVFGYGVDDKHTIGTYLQQALDRDRPTARFVVFNLGHASYFAQQEAALLQKMISDGVHCDVVMFMDGWNEVQAEPTFTAEQTLLYSRYNAGAMQMVLLGISRLTLFQDIHNRQVLKNPPKQMSAVQIVARYQRSRNAARHLADAMGAQAIFLVQPVPGVHNPFLNFPLKSTHCNPGADCQTYLAARINGMAALADPKDTFDLSHFFESWKELPFVDEVHYSPKANQALAEEIEKIILKTVP